MIRASRSLAAATLAAAAASAAQSQSLASRVNDAPDGRVQFTFAARPGICGNGRTYIQTSPNSATGSILYNGDFYGSGNDAARADPCVAGPVTVVIDRADKLPLTILAYVGPSDTTRHIVADLGRVRAQDAAEFLLALSATADGRAGRDALFPAMLADTANTAPALVAIAKNTALPRETRRAALSYMGLSTSEMQAIPASITNAILTIARDESDNRSVRQQALSVLGRLDHGSGIAPLIELSKQTQNSWLAKESMAVLSRSGDPRARQYLRTAVRRTDLPDEVLTVALRALGQTYATARDAALLRELYPSLRSEHARDAVFAALAEIGGSENAKWMTGMARNGDANIAVRRRAAEAADRAGAPIGEMVLLYDTTTDPAMKESLIGIYIRNGGDQAIDKLLQIVRAEANVSVRRRAISRLTSSEDPRIKRALEEIMTRGAE